MNDETNNGGSNASTGKKLTGYYKDVYVLVCFDLSKLGELREEMSYKVEFNYNAIRKKTDANGNETIAEKRAVKDVKDYYWQEGSITPDIIDVKPRCLPLKEDEYLDPKIQMYVYFKKKPNGAWYLGYRNDELRLSVPVPISNFILYDTVDLSRGESGYYIELQPQKNCLEDGIHLKVFEETPSNFIGGESLAMRMADGYVPAQTTPSGGITSTGGIRVPVHSTSTGSGSTSTPKPAEETESQKRLRLVNELVKKYPMIPVEDGYNDPPVLKQEPNKEGVWVRALRQPKHPDGIWFMVNDEINNQLIYPGNIVLVDKEKDFTKNMKEIPFRSGERKPLRFDAKFSTKNSSTVLNSFTRVDVNDFVDDCLREFKEKGYELASNTAWEYEQSTRTEGITLGGTIKGINFSGSALERNKTVTVAYMKQIMYTVSLDNQYSNASDLFTDQVNLDQFKQNIDKNGGAGIVAPAIIDAVRYGRLITVWAVQEGNKPVSLSIDKMFNISVGDTQNNTKFILRVYGGKAGEENFSLSSDSEETIENALKMFKEVDKKAIETALPIEYSLKYLNNLTTNIQWKVLPYFKSYIPRVRMRVKDDVKGVYVNVSVRALKFMPYGDSGSDFDYVRYKSTYCTAPVSFSMSPKTLCIDVIFEMHRGAKYDFNVMIPCIPYERIEGPDEDGDWMFWVKIPSCTYFNAKHIDLYPNVPGAVFSNDEWFYMDKHEDGPISMFDKAHATEKEILQYYLKWQRRKMQEKSYLSWESPIKDLHDLRSYYPRE